MGARAPQAIYALWDDVQAAIPSAILSGIVGDVNHSFGYHLARQQLPGSDYSVTLPLDKKGAADCASALDIKLSPTLMRVCTSRLLAAARAGDPRLKGLREFCGTLNGTQTYPWDLSTNTSEGIDSWDNSHLWHIHLSFYRAYADDYATLAPIAQVIAGIPAVREFTVNADDKVYLDQQFAALKTAADDFPSTIVSPVNGKPYPVAQYLGTLDSRTWQLKGAIEVLAEQLFPNNPAAVAAVHHALNTDANPTTPQ